MSIDALRSDALVALITQGAAIVKPPAVIVTVDLPTLLGLQDNPAELAGYGPIPAELARTLAADGRWRRMILEPQTGDLLDLGHTSYKPTADLSRFVKTRDRQCTSGQAPPATPYHVEPIDHAANLPSSNPSKRRSTSAPSSSRFREQRPAHGDTFRSSRC